MPPTTPQEALYWGLKFSDWVTFAGLLLGPVIAVVLTLIIESRRKKREQRIQVLRMLLATRHLTGDATYSVAINLIPVEFNDSKAVMRTWHAYIEQVRYKATPENKEAHDKVMAAHQTKLIFQVMREIGFKLSETDIQTSSYAAESFIIRDNILINSQLAMPQIAAALRQQIAIMTGTPEALTVAASDQPANATPSGAAVPP